MRYVFQAPGKVVFGEGACKRAVKELPARGKVLLVTDEAMAGSAGVEQIRDALGERLALQFTEVVPDTGVDVIDKAAALARESGAEAVVSVGGGSTIDTAKAVAAVLGSGVDSVREIIGFGKLKGAPLPHVAIPTTAGTGSEVTSMAVIKDREKKRKLILMDDSLIPKAGLLDPLLTVTMPKGVTAATGMDAMTHAAESLMSVRRNPHADALALHAIELITEYLPRAVEQGEDLTARSMMLIAANMAGQAFQNALVGVVHAMAHALGGIAGVPHGLANGVLLWAGMEYNAKEVPDRVARIGKAMGLVLSGNVEKDAEAAVSAMREFTEKVGIPTRLEHAGVDSACIADAAELAFKDPALLTNPRKPESARELEALFRKCM